jgi:hypothetical protein
MGRATSRVNPLDAIETPFQPMKSMPTVCRSGLVVLMSAFALAVSFEVARAGEAPTRNPKAKVILTSAEGPTEITSGSTVREASNRTAYDADNIVIETRRNEYYSNYRYYRSYKKYYGSQT